MLVKAPYNPRRFGSRSKYNNKKVTINGIKFDSKWESERYLYIKAIEKAGTVKDLELQVRFALEVNGEKICTYIADFRYKKQDMNGNSTDIVEAATGADTPEFKLKKKLMKACLGIEIYLSKKK